MNRWKSPKTEKCFENIWQHSVARQSSWVLNLYGHSRSHQFRFKNNCILNKKGGDRHRTQNLLIICLTLYKLRYFGLVHSNWEQLVKKYEQKKDVKFQLKESLKDAQHKWELDTLRLKQSLEKTKLDYLYATKKLSARGAFELFQNRYVFRNKGNKKTAREMWDLFVEEDNMGKEIKKKLEEANCNTPVGEIAAGVYGTLSEGIHNYFSEGLRKVYLVKTEFRRCDLIFLQNIYSALPLSPSDIVVLDNKSQFLYSPPRKT